ncbi:MarR family winged helix-turn-helix transcriptional regulator [Clostridium sp. AL.422]|uniref:MarR family winged helix-turn-helix transcriptional regulator n=1 Tax=Clostridium TaxID=1485 RepID=UPI00293DDBC3|nr:MULTISPECIES: MarR family winged helix-turn-helix transcriptional regulator [unclassified Clostridium]MDV4152277.1 MarR family winged helix-turn-helix transcriptional regulator [Clostridium sp. AL.422]
MNKKNMVIYELRSISNLIKRCIYKSAVNAKCDQFSEIQGMIINYLSNNKDKDIFQRDIEEIFTIRRSTVTGILQSMEKNNLIKRESVPDDARLKKIVLTEFGERINIHIIKAMDDFEDKITKGISDEDLDKFIDIINKLKKNIE